MTSLEELERYLQIRLERSENFLDMGVIPGLQDSFEVSMLKGRIMELRKLQEVVHKMLCPSRPDSPESSA